MTKEAKCTIDHSACELQVVHHEWPHELLLLLAFKHVNDTL